MNIKNLQAGQVLKNYKELCAVLGIKITGGNQKQVQEKEIQRYIAYHKEGYKIIIDEIFKTPKEKIVKSSNVRIVSINGKFQEFKTCIKCGISKPNTSEFYQKKSTNKNDLGFYLRRVCRECTNVSNKRGRKTEIKNCVYRFLNKNDEIIYIGKANYLKERLNGHKHLPKECYEKKTNIEYIEFKTEGDALFAERYFISKYKPKYNKDMINNDITFNIDLLDNLQWNKYT